MIKYKSISQGRESTVIFEEEDEDGVLDEENPQSDVFWKLYDDLYYKSHLKSSWNLSKFKFKL